MAIWGLLAKSRHRSANFHYRCSILSIRQWSPLWTSVTKTTLRTGALKAFTPSTTKVTEYKAPPVTTTGDSSLDENDLAPGYARDAKVFAAE